MENWVYLHFRHYRPLHGILVDPALNAFTSASPNHNKLIWMRSIGIW
ncbi:hypothetical protein ISN45_At02g033440 [Arabidopsis thaliana x Arabidopsis arenosa]|uniref:Uncharacterized protein n=2 Tax=Arabidopsis TaxID=3701 RepID=A0A8T2G817_ARASU|nr:hypothetical protein ISN45_At02g033440 [Arabidopsis thaliana x Arabidopsis arenosa]KAG7643566.1 hypothetical protein ISN44_As02g033640 [Arabidopsis suecica]